MTAWLLLLAVALIAANGFFVGAEFAVLAARRARLEPLLPTSRRARTALRAIEQLPLMISGCQFGITLASLGLGALGEPVVAELLAGPFEAAHLPHELLHPVSIAVALTLVSVLHMLLGEMVPKNLALAGPERAALALAPPLMGFVRRFPARHHRADGGCDRGIEAVEDRAGQRDRGRRQPRCGRGLDLGVARGGSTAGRPA